MSEYNETLADVLAKMRNFACVGKGHEGTCSDLIESYADRIEAAHKREMSKIVSKNGADFGHLGDAAAMREALKTVKRYLDGYTVNVLEMRSQVDAALAAPPRNCDVGDAADWEKRFGEECDKGHVCSDCPVRHARTRMAIELDKGARCEFVWAQMHYTRKEAR